VDEMTAAIEVKNITKTFPGVVALKDVSLCIHTGEVHAIVGENGAGKSTLMKILGGVYIPDYGEVYIQGEKVQLKSVNDSIENGISVIYQEFNLMPELTIAENIFISKLPRLGRTNVLNLKKLKEQTLLLMDRLQIKLDPSMLVKDLSVSQRQVVEILKTVSMDCNIIIMDEPTASLNNKEVEKLYEIIEILKAEKKTIVYISHRFKEIFDLTDRVTVLRDGKYVATEKTTDLDHKKMVGLMIGRDIEGQFLKVNTKRDEIVLSVRNLAKSQMFKGINFDLYKGEILGVSGLVGCGSIELAKTMYGLIQPDSGEIKIKGKQVKLKSASHAIQKGIAFLTEDRKDSGIYAEMSVIENTTILSVRKLSLLRTFISAVKERTMLREFTGFMNIKYANEDQKIMYLSGGNQQKVLLARALSESCDILVLLEPTRGVDVGAKSEIYGLLAQLTERGISIIVVSSDLPELISICGRVAVMFQGSITGIVTENEMTEKNIMQYATGIEELDVGVITV
jgi:ABC-type sugar transport system ATPase subunit